MHIHSMIIMCNTWYTICRIIVMLENDACTALSHIIIFGIMTHDAQHWAILSHINAWYTALNHTDACMMHIIEPWMHSIEPYCTATLMPDGTLPSGGIDLYYWCLMHWAIIFIMILVIELNWAILMHDAQPYWCLMRHILMPDSIEPAMGA